MEILPQIIVIAIISSALYALIATGLTLTFSTLDFINFAHGDTAMTGGYLFFLFYLQLNLPLAISLIFSIIGIAVIGAIIERATFRPVRDKQEFIPLILSIGVAIILQSIVLVFFGSGSKNYLENSTSQPVYHLFNDQIIINLTQIIIIISSILLLTLTYLFLKHSKTGKVIRAVTDNKEVASIMGMNVNRNISILFIIASILAAIGGILTAFDQNLNPQMGNMLSIKAFAAVILGGVGSFRGAIIGATIIGFAENLLIGLTPIPASYKETIAFTILISVLLIKPYGLFGGKKEEVEAH